MSIKENVLLLDENKNQKYGNDVWHWKCILKFRFRHFLMIDLQISKSQVKSFFCIWFLSKTLLPIDPPSMISSPYCHHMRPSWGKILLFPACPVPLLWPASAYQRYLDLRCDPLETPLSIVTTLSPHAVTLCWTQGTLDRDQVWWCDPLLRRSSLPISIIYFPACLSIVTTCRCHTDSCPSCALSPIQPLQCGLCSPLYRHRSEHFGHTVLAIHLLNPTIANCPACRRVMSQSRPDKTQLTSVASTGIKFRNGIQKSSQLEKYKNAGDSMRVWDGRDSAH